MILQSLVAHYETLAAHGKIARLGWAAVPVSFVLYIDDTGALTQVVSAKIEVQKKEKSVLSPQPMTLPAPVKRASSISPNFLCDHSGYMLGFDNKGKPKRTLECFAACKALHESLLSDVDTPAAKAILAFFRTWEPEKATEHPALQDAMEELLKGANLVFRYSGAYPHDDPEIQAAWQRTYDAAGDGPEMVCLVTGIKGPVETIHPSIKKVVGAQSSGAALVSFNADAFCSYGKTQNLNAPTGKYAAFAYTSALNHLLADTDHVFRIGDATVVFWAKNGEPAYQNLFSSSFFDSPSSYSASKLQNTLEKLCKGDSVSYEESRLDPNMDFYILGLSPNAARLSVRFFMHNTFGSIIRNIEAHYNRLEIVRPSFDSFPTIPLWKLLSETTNQNARDKSPAANLSGDTLRAILNNTDYPATLRNGVAMRIRAERNITRGRAAILKAYYTKRPHPDVPKEVLTVSLNPDSSNVPYTLGRLFSVLEDIQAKSANPNLQSSQKSSENESNPKNSGINTTIKDRYFNGASATPSHVFPVLINLAQKHLRKLNSGTQKHYNKKLGELMDKLGESYPTHLSLPQQGAFQLGYYHETQARYAAHTDKEEEENV